MLNRIKTLLFTITVSLLIGNAYANQPKLTVYTYSSFNSEWGPGQKLKTLFEQKCQCELNWVSFEDGVTLFNRLRLEGKNSPADVVVGLDNNLLLDAQKSGLFTEHSVHTQTLALPITWDNRTFLPYDYGQYAFIYDSEKLTNPPKSLKELVERQDVRVIYQDPRTSTVGRGLLAWMNEVYNDQAIEQAWKKLAKHTITVGKGWSETYGAFLKGESDMVLSYNTSPLYHQMYDDTNKYRAAEFSEGHIVQIELAAKLAQTQHSALADQFLTFLISAPAQHIIATHNIMLPVIKTSVNEHFDQFNVTPTLKVPMPESAVSQQQINVWQRALSQ